MARCDDIRLLLGPFEDGELEPHEMQEVARHVVGCGDCEGELADYRILGVSLRGAVAMPDLAGFGAAVLERIEALPIPFSRRVRHYLTSFSDGLGATIATGLAAAAVAVVTAVILTPYFKQAPILVPAEVARRAPSAPSQAVIRPDVAENSGAIISRLESSSPSVAVWSEPQIDTTVIWIPDQSR